MTGDESSAEVIERRERRRRRILENADKRMTSILSGPDGFETRLAPVFDNFTESVDEDNTIFDNNDSLSLMDNEKINFIKPKYLDQIDKNRFYICLALGVAFNFFVLLNLITQIVFYFVVIFLAYKFFTYLLLKYPKHSYAANILFVGGLNERLVVNISRLIEIVWEFFFDLIILMFSYLCTHIIFKF